MVTLLLWFGLGHKKAPSVCHGFVQRTPGLHQGQFRPYESLHSKIIYFLCNAGQCFVLSSYSKLKAEPPEYILYVLLSA